MKRFLPRTFQRLMDANQRGDEDVNVPGLDLLERSDVQVRTLSELLLSERQGISFTPDIGTEKTKLRAKGAATWHAPLRRVYRLELNGALGRNRPRDRRCS